MRAMNRSVLFSIVLCCVLMTFDSPAFASGGSWGSRGLSGGSWGGSRGGLLAGRQPVRNLIGRIANRAVARPNVRGLRSSLAGGFSGGSRGYALGGCTGYSLAGPGLGSTGSSWSSNVGGSVGTYSSIGSTMGSNASSYGSWGSSYVSSLGLSSGSYESTVPVSTDIGIPYDSGVVSYGDVGVGMPVDMGYSTSPDFYSPGIVESGIGIPFDAGYGMDPGITMGSGAVIDSGMGLPMDSGALIDSGISLDPMNAVTEIAPGDTFAPIDMGMSVPLDSGIPADGSTGDSGTGIPLQGGEFSTPGFNSEPTPAGDGKPPIPEPGDLEDTSIRRVKDKAVLTVQVPLEAKVYVNDRLTTTKGERRSFVTKSLASGKSYKYRVRVEWEKSGVKFVKNKVVRVFTGEERTVAFDFQKPRTTLALNVPVGAKVTLCGKPTNLTGSKRYYTTTTLAPGDTWEDYKIEVTVKKNGRDVTKTETITLAAGEKKSLNFEFDSKALAVN